MQSNNLILVGCLQHEREQELDLDSELARINMTKEQMADDLAWVQRESDKVEEFIKGQTAEDQAEKEALLEQKDQVRNEIEELRKQLTLKELEEKRISKRMQVEPHAASATHLTLLLVCRLLRRILIIAAPDSKSSWTA